MSRHTDLARKLADEIMIADAELYNATERARVELARLKLLDEMLESMVEEMAALSSVEAEQKKHD